MNCGRNYMAINKQIERQGLNAEPQVHFYPTVRAGICDRCGVIDPNVESVYQYKLCEHYRGKQLACSYCPSSTHPDEVIKHSILQVMDSPDNANELVVVCNTSECSEKHIKRFRKNS